MKKALRIFILVVLAGGLGYWLYINADRWVKKAGNNYTPAKYARMKDTLSMEREALAERYTSASKEEKEYLLSRASRKFIAAVSDSLFPYWYETDWDFNGTTEVPGEGSIACGYFVTTVLRDAGVNIDRVKLACCASEEMIKSLVPGKHIQRFSNIPIKDFVKAVKKSGDGLYVVGLDNHTGFIICRKGEVRFVHSGGGMPSRVVNQDPEHSKLIANSKYRVIGKLSSSDTFLQKWLTGEKFK